MPAGRADEIGKACGAATATETAITPVSSARFTAATAATAVAPFATVVAGVR
jgi:hypothetical protein